MRRHSQLGFTVIELMVGMTIAMLASIAIFQVLNTSEAFKRTTTAGSDAQQSGSYAEFMLGRTLQMGGSGIAQVPSIWGCTLNIYRDTSQVTSSSDAYTNYGAPFTDTFKTALAGRSTAYSLPIAPAMIFDGGDDSDTLVVMGGQHASQGYYLTANAQPAGGKIGFNNTLGINSTCSTTTSNTACGSTQQDLLLAVDQDSGAGSTTCDIAQAKSIAGGAVTLTGTGTAQYDYTGSSAFNSYSASTLVANLGPVPVSSATAGLKTTSGPMFLAYAVDSSQNLVELNLITGATRTIADNVIAIKAIYGVSSATVNSYVSDWVEASGGTWSAANLNSTSINKLRAIRLAIVTRNTHKEKEQVTGTSLTLFSDSDVSKTLSISAANRYYRYKVYDLVVPLRNMVLAANNS